MLNWSELEADEVLACVRRSLSGKEQLLPTGFLDTHQWLPLAALAGLELSGGFERAQFRIAHTAGTASLVHFALLDPQALPVNARSIIGLRSLLRGSALPDSAVGDIRLDDRFVLAMHADYDLDALGLEADYVGLEPAMAFREEKVTAASLRADAVVSAAFRVSRAEAQKAIEYGFIFHDFRVLPKRTVELQAGSRLVYRTKGMLEIADTGFNPRSGRSWLSVRRLTF